MPKVSEETLYQSLLNDSDTHRGFLLNAAALPSNVETAFGVQIDERHLLLGIHAASVPRCDSQIELEILFGGGAGEYTQILLKEGDQPSYIEFLTGQKSVDSSHIRIRPLRVEWRQEGDRRWLRDVFVFLWFSRDAVFAPGPQVGFNVVRNERALNEFSSWSLLAGNGSPDCESLGVLLLPEADAPDESNATVAPSSSFALQVTNDVFMSVAGKPYTPERLRAEMGFLRERKVSRLYWIDYGGEVPLDPERVWTQGWLESLGACGGEPLRHAAREAKKQGIDLVVDYKLFDFAFNGFTSAEEAPARIRLMENLYGTCSAGLLSREELFVQSNSEWYRPRELPIHVLRFYSRQPLPVLANGEIEVLTSNDNRTYKPWNAAFTVKVERILRPHAAWSPAGSLPSEGTELCYLLEISGLNIHEPFAALRWKTDGQLSNLKFRLAEAEDIGGHLHSLSLTNKRIGESYSYQQPWSGWGNHLERIVSEAVIQLSDVGLCFIQQKSLPGFLEVSHPEVHEFWISGMEKLYSEGAEAICLRVQAHHYTTDSWLNFSFHPVVIQQFCKRFGRMPLPQEDDYVRIRTIRGEAFTAFLRKARALALKMNRRLLFQIESGAELPPAVGTRLQFTYELETWISEKLFDEFVVRGLSPWSPWIRQTLIPLAQVAGVPVHWVTRNLEPGVKIVNTRQADILTAGAHAARAYGFSGVSLYESMALYWPNSAGRIVAQPGAEELFSKVSETVSTSL